MIDLFDLPPVDWAQEPRARQVKRASKLNEAGRQALQQHDLDRAERLFMKSIEKVPLFGPPWFNLGLVFKQQRRWMEAAICNRRSIEVGAGEEDPAYWNLGIAATAVRDWESARWAWSGYGVEIHGNDGPIAMEMGPAPVRINPDTTGEVVWGRRIDPARVVIESVPLPGSGHRWHDIVLHDGVPSGQRTWGDREFAVFDELAIWERSEVSAWECLVVAPADSVEALTGRFLHEGWAAEDWTGNVRALCGDCSRGSVESHPHGAFFSDSEGRHIGIAAPLDVAGRLLDDWTREATDRSRTDLIAVET